MSQAAALERIFGVWRAGQIWEKEVSKMKVSDYIFSYLESLGVATVFTLTGGGIMHLVDSLGRSRIEYVCCHHEQAAGIAAQSYAMERDGLGV